MFQSIFDSQLAARRIHKAYCQLFPNLVSACLPLLIITSGRKLHHDRLIRWYMTRIALAYLFLFLLQVTIEAANMPVLKTPVFSR